MLDDETAAAQLAFTGIVAPNAVPSTLVLDAEGSLSPLEAPVSFPSPVSSVESIAAGEDSLATVESLRSIIT